MQINVSQQLKSNIGTTRDYEVETTVDIDGEEVEYRGNISLMKTDRGILANGVFHTEIGVQCSRCLNIFSHPVTLNIVEEYFPTIDIITGLKIQIPEDPGSFTIDDHNIIDISEAIRQYTLMALPIKPLCSQDCAGLCPSCGANLNETTCSCKPDMDPRWIKLKNLVSADTEYSAES